MRRLSKARLYSWAFSHCCYADAVSYETLIAAYGMAGRAEDAEKCFSAMLAAGECAGEGTVSGFR